MKKFFVLFAALYAACSVLGAQDFYEGQGGRDLGGIRVAEITGTGLSGDEAELLPLIRLTLGNDFEKYAGMTVPSLEDTSFTTRYTLTGTISKTDGRYFLSFAISDNSTGIQRASYGPIQHTLEELRTLRGIKAASEALITGMGVTLTRAGREALRTTATNEADAMNLLARSLAVEATEFERMLYTYQAQHLDPTLAEAARRVAAYQTEIYRAPEINLAMPVIQIPEIRVPEFRAPEIRMAATGNIGADARRQLEQYNAQREASRVRQESGNSAIQDLQNAFLAQFRAQSEAVAQQQAELLGQRDILREQQRNLLARQRHTIAQLRETENSYDTFFSEHPPIEIIYDPAVNQVGTLNLERGTINLQFRISTVGTQALGVIPIMLADFERGLRTIGQGFNDINAEFDRIQTLLTQAETAGRNALAQLVSDYAAQMARVQAAENDYAAQLAQLDRELGTTGYAQLGRDYAVRPDTGYAERLAREYAVRPAGYNAAADKTAGDAWSLARWNRDVTRTFAIQAALEDDAGRTIGRATVTLTNRSAAATYTQPASDSAYCVFRDVQANSITDTMRVLIQRVNGRDVTAAANAGYIKISPLEADGFTSDGWDIDGYGRDGFTVYGWDRDGYARDGYNKDGYDRGGYARDGYNKEGYDRDGYNREGYNRAGYARNGYDRYGYDRDGFNRDEYNRDGYDRAGYDRSGYNRDGYDRDGRNRMGQTREQVERAAQRAARQAVRAAYWHRPYCGIFAGGAFAAQPSGAFLELGTEFGLRWLVLDGGMVVGNMRSSLSIDNAMVEERFGFTNWETSTFFSWRIGASVAVIFGRTRINLGGGVEWLPIGVKGNKGKKLNNEGNEVTDWQYESLDRFTVPYVGTRLDIAFTELDNLGLFGFIGYRCGFLPAGMAPYLKRPSSTRHTIFLGLEMRVGFW